MTRHSLKDMQRRAFLRRAYALGMAGAAAPLDATVLTAESPVLRLEDLAMQVTFSGMVPGYIALYQVNAVVPSLPHSKLYSGCTLTIAGQTTEWQYPSF